VIRRRAAGRLFVGSAVALAVIAAAVPVASAVLLFGGIQRATWMRVVVDGDRPTPPVLHAIYGAGAREQLPVLWENAAPSTLLGLSSTAPAKLLAIDTDRGAVAPWLASTWANAWQRVESPSALLIQGAGVVEIAGAFQRFTLTFAPAPATIEVGWLDQQASLDLSPAPGKTYSVTLTIPKLHRGWVLLPPIQIDRLALRSAPEHGQYALREVSVHAPARQIWSAASVATWHRAGHACPASPQGDRLVVTTSPLGACTVPLEGLTAVNRVAPATWFVVWSISAAVLAAALCALTIAVRRLAAFVSRYELVETTTSRWLREHAASLTLRRVMLGVAVCTLGYHVTFILAVPFHFNFDSLGYYAFGRNLLHTGDLASVATCRTPGYPGLIALSILAFGHNLYALVALQHLALWLLGLGAVRLLYPLAGPVLAGVGGLFIGASPILALAANVVSTEAIFGAVATAALLLFLYRRDPGLPMLFTAGVLAGVATLVRPNGVLTPILMVGWLIVQWWFGAETGSIWRLARRAGTVVVGFAFVVSFWLLHVHAVTGNWAVSDANCSLERQASYTLSRGLRPTTVFQLAGFFNFLLQNDDTGTLAIAEPYRVFPRFFPARHRFMVYRFVPGSLIYDDRYPGELLREYPRVFPRRYARQAADALLFNLTHVERANPSIFVDEPLEDLLRLNRSRTYTSGQTVDPRVATLKQAPTLSWQEADILLAGLSKAWVPRLSRVRAAHLSLSGLTLSLWGVIVGLAGLGLLVCLLTPGFRRFIILGGHAASLTVAPALVAMGVDRYATMAEPVLYVLIALLLSLVVFRRPRAVDRRRDQSL
jgi:hypothetical protein